MAYKKPDIYQEITDKIIKHLEKGCAPWVKPWSDTETEDGTLLNAMPHNAATEHHYSGINIVLLKTLA